MPDHLAEWMKTQRPDLLSFFEGKAEPEPADSLMPEPDPGAYVRTLFMKSGVPERYRLFTLRSFAEHVARCKASMAGKASALKAVEDILTKDDNPGLFDDTPKGLLLFGEPGMGKSGLTASLANDLVRSRKGVLWIQYNEFIKAIQSGYSDSEGGADTEERVRLAQTIDHLFLEDLGNPALAWKGEMETYDRQEIVWRVINDRYMSGRWRIFITSNVGLNALADQYQPRTLERILAMCRCIEVSGANIRRLAR